MLLQLNEKNRNTEITDTREPSISDNSFDQCNRSKEDDNENEKLIESSSNSFSFFEDKYLFKKRTSSIISLVLFLIIMIILIATLSLKENYAKMDKYLTIQSKMFQLNKEYMLVLFLISMSRFLIINTYFIVFGCLLLSSIIGNTKEINELISNKFSFQLPVSIISFALLMISFCSEKFIRFGISSILSFFLIGN